MKYLFPVVFTFLSFNAFAQEDSVKLARHEIGLNLYSFSNAYMYRENSTLNHEAFPQHAFFNGVMYKFHFKKSALRGSFSNSKKEFPEMGSNEDNQVGDYYSGSVVSKELRVGYEHQFGESKFKPYAALEFTYLHSFNDAILMTSCSLDPLCCGSIPFKTSTTTLGIIPSIGASYQFSKLFSLRLETSATIGGNQQVTSTWYGDYKYYSEVEPIFIFNPISTLSFNVHF